MNNFQLPTITLKVYISYIKYEFYQHNSNANSRNSSNCSTEIPYLQYFWVAITAWTYSTAKFKSLLENENRKRPKEIM